MSMFAVMSEVAQPELRNRVESLFPESYYHWSDTVSFVRTTGTAKQIAEKLEIKSRDSEGKISGTFEKSLVMSVSPSYFGWSKTSLWEWLKQSFEADN